MTEATIIATLSSSPSTLQEELSSLPSDVKWLEIRADITGDLDPNWLRARFGGNLLYTLRSAADGGSFEGSADDRRRRLLEAAGQYDLIDLEGERDLLPEFLDEIPPSKRLISWQGPATTAADLLGRLEQLSRVEARVYKLVVQGKRAGDELAALSMLKRAGRRDVIAYTTGKECCWSRLVSPYLGCPMIFGTASQRAADIEEPTVHQLISDYHFPKLEPFQEIYGIVGDPVQHSLSPRLHNAAYRALGYPALFLPFHAESFESFWRGLIEEGTLDSLGLNMKGFTVCSPHKETALGEVKAASAMVQRAGSTNIFVRSNGAWRAETTDPEGVVDALHQRRIDLSGKKAAVVGCGGSGRAIAAALDSAGAHVTLVNRGLVRGRRAVALLGLPFVSLSEFKVDGYDVIVNATPVGRDNGDLPFRLDGLGSSAAIIDLVYASHTTPLMEGARSRGNVAIDGLEVLFLQVRRQFQLMTGRQMPEELARAILGMTPRHLGSAM